MDAATLSERDRRFALLDDLMDAEGLDALLFTSTAQQGSAVAVKYLTGYALTTRRAWAFKVPGQEPFLVVPTGVQAYHADRVGWLPPGHITANADMVDHIIEWLRDLSSSNPVIGVYESEDWPTHAARALESTGARFVDITAAFTDARAVKSSWEMGHVRRASEMALGSFEASVRELEPGRNEWQVMGAAEGYLRSNGAEETLMLCRSTSPHGFIAKATNRVIEEGDVFVYSVELAGPGGYWTQLVRPVFMSSEAHPHLRDMLQVSRRAIDAGIEQFRTGRVIGDIARAIEEIVVSERLVIGHVSGHGMGADLGDATMIEAGNTTPIRPGMVLTIHPSIVTEDGNDGIFFGNTYVSTEGAAENLTAGYDDVIDYAELRRQVGKRSMGGH